MPGRRQVKAETRPTGIVKYEATDRVYGAGFASYHRHQRINLRRRSDVQGFCRWAGRHDRTANSRQASRTWWRHTDRNRSRETQRGRGTQAAVERSRHRFPVPAGCRRKRIRRVGDGWTHAPDRRQHGTPDRPVMGVRPAGIEQGAAHEDSHRRTGGQCRLPRGRLHPADASAGGGRRGAEGLSGDLPFAHRLQRRWQENDRGIRSAGTPALSARCPSPLRAGYGPQAPARDAEIRRTRFRARVQSDRVRFLQGHGGGGSACRQAARKEGDAEGCARHSGGVLQRRTLCEGHALP